MNVLTSINTRAIQAAAEDKILPSCFAAKNKYGQPIVAVVLMVVICSVISLFPTYLNEIVNLGVLFNFLTMFISVIALKCARKKEKTAINSFRVKGGTALIIIFLVVLVLCNISNIITSDLLMVCIYTVVILIIGIIIFAIAKRNK